MIYYQFIASPLGQLLLRSDGRSLTGLYLQNQKYYPEITEDWNESLDLEIFIQAQQQLAEYFAHQRQSFELPLAPRGTEFQQQIWQQLRRIPFGTAISYGALAQQIGQPQAARAVGMANGRNPLSIVVPCHRVIASNGHLTGYAGGIDRKQWLLQHESKSPTRSF